LGRSPVQDYEQVELYRSVENLPASQVSGISEAFAESAADSAEKHGFRLHATARNTCTFKR